MSRTDKTDPWWVKIARRDPGVKELHSHHGRWFSGVCELTNALPMTRRGKQVPSCEAWINYYGRDSGKFFGRRPRKAVRKELGLEGHNRMLLNRMRGQWRGGEVDVDGHGPSRQREIYDRWMWD